ncbi:hypothetical protein FRC10_002753 [Ceratobasidium sp. 414]|nr:hypothetical protein FRC10_002753 [Ceratobasidium sp. 414]
MDYKTKRGFSRIKKLLLRVSSDPEPTSPIQRASGPAIPLIDPHPTHALLQPCSVQLAIPPPDLEVHSRHPSPAPILLASLVAEPCTEYEGWAELKTFAGLLSKCAAMFGPLKQAIDGFMACIETFEIVGENREDYQKLKVKLNILFYDLHGYFGESAPPGMRSSVADLAEGIKQELKVIQKKQREHGFGSYIKAKRDADEVWLCYHRIQGLFERFMVNANVSTWKVVAEQTIEAHLKNLPNSPDAMYRSAKSSSLRGGCTSDTRVEVLEQLHKWACDSKSEKICWLNGMAGTGKTTIAYSVCEQLKDAQKLAASFFCSRQLPKCRDVNRIVPSISYQLSRFSRPFRYAISRVLEENPEVHNQLLPDQFRQLILEPLKQVKDSLPTGLVIVVDALDECDDNNDVDRILDVLLSSAQELPVKFFVTSRPEPKILDRMRDQEGRDIRIELRLHELAHQSVQKDIRTYLRAKLGARVEIPADDLDTLVKRSGVLFIYAATVARHIEEDNFAWAAPRLGEVLSMSDSSSDDVYGKVNELYTGILEAAFHGSKRSEQEKMKRIIHTVACAQEPLSVHVLAGLLGLDGKTSVRPALRLLRSVLQLSDTTHIVTTLHDSFPNYLFDKNLSGPFYCDARAHNALLGQYCIEQIKIPNPPFNICNLDSSYVFDRDVPDLPARVEGAISNALFYSCRYWGAHLVSANDCRGLADMLFEFLSERLLLWMEVMNLKRCIHDGTRTLYQVQKWSQNVNWQDETIKRLLRDAWMFTTSFSLSPAMLAYSSDGANITASFHDGVAYSPDGQHIVSGSYDKTIRIWDAQTGQPLGQPLQGHTWFVTSVAYSPDGAYIASGSHDKTVRIWDAHTGQSICQPLRGHTWFITSVAYSPDGAYIVSGSDDKTIRMWDARTGQAIGPPLHGHTESVSSVAYSPDGASVLSGSHDNTVRIWDAQSSVVKESTPGFENNPIQTIEELHINHGAQHYTVVNQGT